MLSATTVIDVGFADYHDQFLWALNWSVERLDDVLAERPKELESEGFATVADAVSAAAEQLGNSPDQVLQVFQSKLSDRVGADVAGTVLTKYAVRDLIAELVDGAHADACLNAVHRGRSVLASLAVGEMASAAEAIGVLEGLLRMTTEVTKPMALRHGERVAARWFRDYESSTARPTDGRGTPAAEAPAAIIEGLVEAGINAGLDAGQVISDEVGLRLVAEFPASFCPPIGKPLAYGSVGIVEDTTGRRVAVFRAEGRTSNGLPTGGLLDLPGNAKAKMGGRIDLPGNHYIIVGGGKPAARALLSELRERIQ